MLDRHCVSCHGGLKPAGDLDFSGGLTTGIRFKTLYGGELGLDGHNTAYRTLITKGLVAYSHKSDPPNAISKPLAFGSHRSKLIAAIRGGPCGKRASLSAEDWLRRITATSSTCGRRNRRTICRPIDRSWPRSGPCTRGDARRATRRRK
jgi:hypothetical protein